MITVCIGYDPRQGLSFTTLVSSIIRHASQPVKIIPLVIDTLPLPRECVGLTPFTFTRYLVPWICGFEGSAIFLDADILVKGDIVELVNEGMPDKPVSVCKSKPRFEWSSVMVFHCALSSNTVLTPEYVAENKNICAGLKWLDEEEIGNLPDEWNHCVFYDEPNPEAKLIHYTAGIPAFPEVQGCEHEEAWKEEASLATSTVPWQVLMGKSVHVGKVQEHLIAMGKLHPPRPDAKTS